VYSKQIHLQAREKVLPMPRRKNKWLEKEKEPVAAMSAVVSMPAPASASRSVPVCIIPRLLTVLDASKYLSTTTWQIDELVRNNIVPSFILGQRRVIDRLELDRFVDRRAAAFVYAGILHLERPET
jgi:hypothetical protein